MESTNMQSLTAFQQAYPEGFKSITVDITGFCNAKCKYCPSGNDLSHKGEFMSLERYEQVLNKLLEYRFLTNSTSFHIYGIGEPLLHPQIDQVLQVTDQYRIKTNISTNASVAPKIGAQAAKAVARVLISMPGFSQASQDRIHGFSFETVKRNILRLREMLPSVPFDMTYHIYQFNLDEMDAARAFCQENQIRFAPNYAVLFDRNKCLDYVYNRLPYEEMKQMSKELFLQALEHQIESAPKGYCDFINRYLSVNADGDIRLCNNFTKSYEGNILCGSLFHDSADTILQKKSTHPFCPKCMEAGLTFAEGYDCKSFPNFYFSLLRENEYLRDHFVQDPTQIEEKLRFMHQVRFWEQEHFSHETLVPVLETIENGALTPEDIRDIVCGYARFKEDTYQRLCHILEEKEEHK